MAKNKLSGITLEIGGDTTDLSKALKEPNREASELQSMLRAVDQALKFDPDNVDLLDQKFRLLENAIEANENRLDILKQAQDEFIASGKDVDTKEYIELEKQIAIVSNTIDNLNKKKIAMNVEDEEIDELTQRLNDLENESVEVTAKLKTINQALKFDSDNVGLLEQKFNLLETAIKTDEDRLDALTQAQDDFIASGGDLTSIDYLELERDIASVRSELNQLESEKANVQVAIDGANGVVNELNSIQDEIDETEDSSNNLKQTMQNMFNAETLADAGQSVIDTLSGIVEESQEYSRIMGALEVSSQSLGYTTDQTRQTYMQLYGILGDTQTAATATSNLQAIGLSQDQLIQMTEGAIGAWTRYGDSIPIDGLAESINETIKTATVTGNFADVLNWAGTSEDDFNEKLAKANTSTERANIVLQELADQGLIESADAFRDANSDMIDYNESQADLEESTATLGETMSPVFTGLNEIITSLLNAFNSLPGPVQTVIVAITGILAVATMLSPIILTITTTMGALNISLLPIAGVILGIVAAVTAVILIFQNWDAIVQWFKEQWENFKTSLSGVSETIDNIVAWFSELPGKISTWLGNIINDVVTWGSNLYNNAKTAVTNTIDNIVTWFKELPGKIWTWLTNIVGKIGEWGSDMYNKAKSAVSDVVDGIVDWFGKLPDKMVEIGKNLVQGLWNGIKNVKDWIIDKIGGFADSVVDSICSFFGINSPSTIMRDLVGKNLVLGMAEGITDNEDKLLNPISDLEKGMETILNPAINASVQQALDYNGTITVECPIQLDLDGKVIYTNIVRRVTKNQASRMMFKGA